MKNKLLLFILLSAFIIASCISVSAIVVTKTRDPIAAGDVCSEHLIHECSNCVGTVMLQNVSVPDGKCPRCYEGDLSSVCSQDFKVNDAIVYIPCDDETHPEGCEIRQILCYTNFSCLECDKEYFKSGIETHVESSEHTLVEDSEVHECQLPIVYPRKIYG